jgi:putative transposase
MGLPRSTFYDAAAASADDTAIVEAIGVICDEFECYGWRRVRAALRQQGLIVNHKKIKRLMREHGLQPKIRRRYVATTDSNHDQPIFPNLAKDMVLDGPNQLWVADITYVTIAVGFVYVAVILDAWSRRVVGYAISRSIDARLTIAALKLLSNGGSRRLDVSITRIAARNTLPSAIARNSQRAACSAPWAGAAIHMITPRRKAS